MQSVLANEHAGRLVGPCRVVNCMQHVIYKSLLELAGLSDLVQTETIEMWKTILVLKSKLKYEAMIAVPNPGRGYHTSSLTSRKLPFVSKNGSHLKYHHPCHGGFENEGI